MGVQLEMGNGAFGQGHLSRYWVQAPADEKDGQVDISESSVVLALSLVTTRWTELFCCEACLLLVSPARTYEGSTTRRLWQRTTAPLDAFPRLSVGGACQSEARGGLTKMRVARLTEH